MFSGFLHLLGPCVRFIFIALWFLYFTFWLFLFYFCRLKNIIHVVQNISLPGQSTAEINAQVDLDTETVYEPTGLNFLDHDKTKFFCTVITKASHETTAPYGA